MSLEELHGRRVDLSAFSADMFDREYAALGKATRVWALAAEAFGPDYPAEVQPWGTTTWWTLGRLVATARAGPGETVVDVGCGRGGPGLWLARATGANLVGVDWSAVAVAQAGARAEHFLPPGRATFCQGDLAATGLPSGSADVVICLDALPFAADRVDALAEAYRLLRPGGRYLATVPAAAATGHPGQVEDWSALAHAAGLVVDSIEEIPDFSEQLAAMWSVWRDNEDVLRDELGDLVATQLLDRARGAGVASQQRQVLLCASRGLPSDGVG